MTRERSVFLQRSRERLARRRAELAEAFRRELESKMDRVKAASELLDDVEEHDIVELTKSVAAHGELGAALRGVAAEIDSIDRRIAAVDAQIEEARKGSG